MFTVVMVALVAPVVVGVALLVMRDRLPRLATDTRGIALQTVIIIVVLLAIAGSVAGVLLSRASDVTGELEAAEIGIGVGKTSASCVRHAMGVVDTQTVSRASTGHPAKPVGVWNSTASSCTWTGVNKVATLDGWNITAAQCHLIGGSHTTGTGATSSCTVT